MDTQTLAELIHANQTKAGVGTLERSQIANIKQTLDEALRDGKMIITATQTVKVFHFQLLNGMGNKSTLICYLKDGSIQYSLYTGWTSSGTPESLSNLQCKLPVEIDTTSRETKDQFIHRVMLIINAQSVRNVFNVVGVHQTFEL